jgi:hypothetical protein
MNSRTQKIRCRWLVPAAFTFLLWPVCLRAQVAPRTAKAAAPIDLTGNWVAIVTEDWLQRMVTPPKGDYASIPINAAAKQVGDAWDPQKDEAAHEECRGYGAPGLMRAPTRLRISWSDDTTLKVESDYGTQTRLFHFGNWSSPGGPATWQGDSVARWEVAPNAGEGASRSGSLRVITTHLRPGYLRKNGVPYSENAVLTEYWDLFKEAAGEQWIEITSIVDDPKYLRQPWATALHFKKESNDNKWDPTACSATW